MLTLAAFCILCGFAGNSFLVRKALEQALEKHQDAFHISLSSDSIDRLANYYDVVIRHNDLLHLVAPCSPEEFAVRHILESLVLLKHLPPKTRFADIGTGAGLPAIPCLIVRDDLRAVLIESKLKKGAFLTAALNELDLSARAHVVNKQFQETDPAGSTYITCRALDKFSQNLPRLLRWCGRREFVFFGGSALANSLRELGVRFEQKLLPLSEQRYIYFSDARSR